MIILNYTCIILFDLYLFNKPMKAIKSEERL